MEGLNSLGLLLVAPLPDRLAGRAALCAAAAGVLDVVLTLGRDGTSDSPELRFEI
jgi:hypothetical protein